MKSLINISLVMLLNSVYSTTMLKGQVLPDSLFNQLFRKPCGGWIAGDATYSVSLPDGRTMFLMGDSFIGEVTENNDIAPGSKMIRNCALILEDDSLRALYGGTYENPDDFVITDLPDSTWYWPEHGIVEGNILKIFMAKYTTDPNGIAGWNFEYIGHDIAHFSLPEIQLQKISSLTDYQANGVKYGSTILQDSNYLYIYGRKEDTSSGFTIPYPHLAKTMDSLSGEWDFFNGEDYSSDPTSSEPINTFQVSQQFSVFKHNNKYVLLTQDIWFSPEIYSFTSETPFGTWQNKTLLYSTPIKFDGSYTYNAFAHPQFDDEENLLVSYNTNGNFSDIFTNVDIYRPTFIRIPFGLIDPEFGNINPNNVVDKQKTHEIECYPNPANTYVQLYNYPTETGLMVLTIYNTSGKLEKTINLISNTQKININDLQEGIHLVHIKNSSTCLTGKFIKSKY